MKHVLLLTSFLFSGLLSFAQQEPQHYMFWINRSYQNPAFSGFSEKHLASLSYRNQWIDFNGNPQTIMFQADARFDKYNSGLGINYYHDQNGVTRSNVAMLNYNYQLELGEMRKIAAGLGVGYHSLYLDASGFLPSPDPQPTGTEGAMKLSAGIAYRSEKFEIGFGSTHLLEPEFEELLVSASRHYYLMAAYGVRVSDNLIFTPGFQFESNASFMQYQLTIQATMYEKIQLGTLLRGRNAIGFNLQYLFREKFFAALAYEITLSPLRDYSNNTIEAMIGFKMQ